MFSVHWIWKMLCENKSDEDGDHVRPTFSAMPSVTFVF